MRTMPGGLNSDLLPGRFITTIYHPNVSPTTGDICVSTLQKDWRPDLGIAHLLLVCTISPWRIIC